MCWVQGWSKEIIAEQLSFNQMHHFPFHLCTFFKLWSISLSLNKLSYNVIWEWGWKPFIHLSSFLLFSIRSQLEVLKEVTEILPKYDVKTKDLLQQRALATILQSLVHEFKGSAKDQDQLQDLFVPIKYMLEVMHCILYISF